MADKADDVKPPEVNKEAEEAAPLVETADKRVNPTTVDGEPKAAAKDPEPRKKVDSEPEDSDDTDSEEEEDDDSEEEEDDSEDESEDETKAVESKPAEKVRPLEVPARERDTRK